MRTSVIIIDEFYNNADEVRAFVLSKPFSVYGKYPGARTDPLITPSVKSTIQAAVQVPITHWPEDRYNGAFQLTTASDVSWIHHDDTTWAGVLYLTPSPPPGSGTAFFQHKATGIDRQPTESDAARLGMTLPQLSDTLHGDAYEPEAWHKVDEVGNQYNRLILFRGDRWHKSMNYFGTGPADGRLFQNFFFDTKY